MWAVGMLVAEAIGGLVKMQKGLGGAHNIYISTQLLHHQSNE
jgi:hypothetical protein